MLDGIPDWFVGLLLPIWLRMVGHRQLRHNFKASSIYDFKAINSDEIKARNPAGSVMDYP